MFSVDLRSLEKQKEPRLPIGAGAFISDERPRGEAALPSRLAVAARAGRGCRQRRPDVRLRSGIFTASSYVILVLPVLLNAVEPPRCTGHQWLEHCSES